MFYITGLCFIWFFNYLDAKNIEGQIENIGSQVNIFYVCPLSYDVDRLSLINLVVEIIIFKNDFIYPINRLIK